MTDSLSEKRLTEIGFAGYVLSKTFHFRVKSAGAHTVDFDVISLVLPHDLINCSITDGLQLCHINVLLHAAGVICATLQLHAYVHKVQKSVYRNRQSYSHLKCLPESVISTGEFMHRWTDL